MPRSTQKDLLELEREQEELKEAICNLEFESNWSIDDPMKKPNDKEKRELQRLEQELKRVSQQIQNCMKDDFEILDDEILEVLEEEKRAQMMARKAAERRASKHSLKQYHHREKDDPVYHQQPCNIHGKSTICFSFSG